VLKKISVLEAAGDLNTVTTKLSSVLMAGVFCFSPALLWAAQMLLAASFEALQCKGPASTQESTCHPEDDLTDPEEVSFQVKGYTFSEPVHLTVSYGPSSPAAPTTLTPAPQKPDAPETTSAKPPGPLPPLPTPSSKDPDSFSPLQGPDPHLYHQMGVLLKQIQDMRVLLGHLVTELRDLSSHLKSETTKGPTKH
uniref:Fc receptor like A n=1 Tax=Moschus moschiferus TaxID=68415 RepID=A0A8C6CKB6_MOSMO